MEQVNHVIKSIENARKYNPKQIIELLNLLSYRHDVSMEYWQNKDDGFIVSVIETINNKIKELLSL